MKTTSFLSILFLFNLFSITNFAQGEAAVPFLLLNPSPSLSAMGATGTALPTEDPFGFLWNPAQLGLTSQTNNLSFIFYPSKLEWLPTFNLDLELRAIALNAGYNFKDLIGFPLSFGFGYSDVNFNYGTFVITDPGGPDPIGTFEPEDYYHAYSFGLGVDYFVQLSIGYTIKDVTSELGYLPGEEDSGRAETTVNDFGILLNVPVLKLINDKMQVQVDENLFALPIFNFSMGYSKSNIGDRIDYNIFPGQSDPLPRMDRLGYGISTGFDLVSDNFRINAFNLSFTVEADDILVTRDSIGNSEYQSTLSDLKFWKNIVQIEGDEKIVSRTGTKLEFVESFAYYLGHFSGRGYPDPMKTSGYEIRAKGLLKLCALWAKHPVTDFLRDHFDIRYYNTNYFADAWNETKMTGLAFYVHNLNEVF
jgi:hypothetical protein